MFIVFLKCCSLSLEKSKLFSVQATVFLLLHCCKWLASSVQRYSWAEACFEHTVCREFSCVTTWDVELMQDYCYFPLSL